MNPTNDGGPASSHSGGPTNHNTERHPHDPVPAQDIASSDIPEVFGTELAPIGAAQYPRVTVQHQACGHVHVHHKFEVDAKFIVRSPACAKHTEYRVLITAVVPSASERKRRAA